MNNLIINNFKVNKYLKIISISIIIEASIYWQYLRKSLKAFYLRNIGENRTKVNLKSLVINDVVV